MTEKYGWPGDSPKVGRFNGKQYVFMPNGYEYALKQRNHPLTIVRGVVIHELRGNVLMVRHVWKTICDEQSKILSESHAGFFVYSCAEGWTTAEIVAKHAKMRECNVLQTFRQLIGNISRYRPSQSERAEWAKLGCNMDLLKPRQEQ